MRLAVRAPPPPSLGFEDLLQLSRFRVCVFRVFVFACFRVVVFSCSVFFFAYVRVSCVCAFVLSCFRVFVRVCVVRVFVNSCYCVFVLETSEQVAR